MSASKTVQTLATILNAKQWRLALAESCTGGLVCATLTEQTGSSDWFERGYITYSNDAKTVCLGVPADLIKAHGAVSEAVARAMAAGAQDQAGVNVSISITGVAGPSGGSIDKPVGTVCFGWAIQNDSTEIRVVTKTRLFDGNRHSIRHQACEYALTELVKLLEN